MSFCARPSAAKPEAHVFKAALIDMLYSEVPDDYVQYETCDQTIEIQGTGCLHRSRCFKNQQCFPPQRSVCLGECEHSKTCRRTSRPRSPRRGGFRSASKWSLLQIVSSWPQDSVMLPLWFQHDLKKTMVKSAQEAVLYSFINLVPSRSRQRDCLQTRQTSVCSTNSKKKGQS